MNPSNEQIKALGLTEAIRLTTSARRTHYRLCGLDTVPYEQVEFLVAQVDAVVCHWQGMIVWENGDLPDILVRLIILGSCAYAHPDLKTASSYYALMRESIETVESVIIGDEEV